jgi:hypothetical protein
MDTRQQAIENVAKELGLLASGVKKDLEVLRHVEDFAIRAAVEREQKLLEIAALTSHGANLRSVDIKTILEAK